MSKSQEQTSTATSNPSQETTQQGQSIEERFEGLANMASPSKGPGSGAPPARAPAPTIPRPRPIPASSASAWYIPGPGSGTGPHRLLAPAARYATGHRRGPGSGTTPRRLLAAIGRSGTSPHRAHRTLASTTGYFTSHWRGPDSEDCTSGSSTTPLFHLTAASGKRIARIAGRASSLMQSSQPAGTPLVPNPRADTLPADFKRNASTSRDKTPDADFTIDELQQDQVFFVTTSSTEGQVGGRCTCILSAIFQ
ncbi:hypothetical protein C7212DRAFT_344971 [Tuber magnatum]|uniref:Uncharacterized protein n=1 Tax=Tuber magnatum TaxID=42249 RepID=A0A317SNV1_9PEZI|nr:hypothetical protein C7212DRAFT_344971 [Tuber magnatum]